jgi:hypothetical protein
LLKGSLAKGEKYRLAESQRDFASRQLQAPTQYFARIATNRSNLPENHRVNVAIASPIAAFTCRRLQPPAKAND